MKKLTIIFIVVLAVAVMAAQKPCSEVFPNAGIKATLGLDGSRCIVSKVKEQNREMTAKFMISHDNSFITANINFWVIKDEVKQTYYARFKCEDVGAGQRFECETETNANAERESIERNGILFSKDIQSFFNMAQVSVNDLYYLFGGPAPWEIMY